MVWQLYEPEDSDVKKSDGFSLSLGPDATNAELLAATVSEGWHSYDDSENAKLWNAVVIEAKVNTFILRWEDPEDTPDKQIRKLLYNLQILLGSVIAKLRFGNMLRTGFKPSHTGKLRIT